MPHTKLKKSTISNDLTSIPPFYIDRKARAPIVRHPRCLYSHKMNSQSMGNLSLAAGRKSDRFHQNQLSFRSFEISPQAQSNRYAIQCQTIRTQMFKQALKEMLQELYQARDKQLGEITQRVRVSQVEKIQNSMLKLYIEKRRIFKQIKKSCEHLEIKTEMAFFKRQIRRHIQQQCDGNQEILQILENFLVNFLITNESGSTMDKEEEKQIQNEQHTRKGDDHTSKFQTTMPDMVSLFSERGLGLSLFGKSTFSSFNVKKDEVLPEQIETAKKFINKFKTFKTLKSGSQNLPILVKQVEKQEPKQKTIEDNVKQNDQKQTNLSSGDKFYKVIKQILIKSKQEKGGQTINEKSNTSTPCVGQQSVEGRRNHSKIIDRSSKTERGTRNDTNSLNKKTLKSNSKGQNRRVRIVDSIQQESTVKNKRKQGQKSKSPLSKKQSKKGKSSTKQKKGAKKILEASEKQKEQAQGQTKGQKPKPKARLQKIGVNYAKFIGKILKATEGDKSNNGVDKFKYFRKINTRQAFLKKKNKYALIDEQLADLHLQNLKLNEERTQRILNDSNLQSVIDSMDSDQAEKRGRMTKYEEARLMYNMRNIKSRDLITNSNSLNWSFVNEIQKKKRPSFCAALEVPEVEGRLKNPQGSFSKYKNSQTSHYLDVQDNIGIGIFQQKSKKSKCSSNSSRYLNQNEELQLTQLTNYEQFDLKTVKSNITSYLRKFMEYNDKAKELYNFLMFMQQSRKVTLEQQEINSSLDQLKIQKEEDQIKKVIGSLQVQVEEYEGCSNLYEYTTWNDKNFSIANKRFIDKLDARSIDLLYWNSEDSSKAKENLEQRSLKQITNIPI